MKKICVISAFFSLVFLSCNEKKEVVSVNEPITALEGSKSVSVDVSDYDRYEGKIVEATTGQWFLIKEGARWRTNSVESSDDYLKKLPVGPDYVVKNVPMEILQQFPEVGELLPKKKKKKDEKFPVK